jgi:glyoxylase-like metal-dependent hydrolase (beta-lactamase superfamily II)
MSFLAGGGRVVPLALAALGTFARPSPLTAQAGLFTDSLLDRVRAVARATPGERPRALHLLKVVESAGPLSNYVAVPDSQRVPSCYSAFQIRYRDRWIVVDAASDREALGPNSRATFFKDRYDRLQAALQGAEHVVLTHEHLDHAGGVQRGPHFQEVAAKTLLTDEQLRTFLDPPAPRGVIRLSRDSAAAFPVLRYDVLFSLAPGVVLIKAPGHTPGSQYVYVQLASGREILILADLVWQSEGLETGQQKPEAASRSLGEDRPAVLAQMDWARTIAGRGDIAVVLSHDSRSLDALVARGVLRNDFDLRLP